MQTSLILACALVAACLSAISCDLQPNADRTRRMPLAASSPSAALSAKADAPSEGDRHGFVGSTACVGCHRAEAEAHASSHHARALRATTGDEDKARFDGSHFSTARGGATKFRLNEHSPEVQTLLSKGTIGSLEAPYVSGVWPLQQFVVAGARGKLQSLGVAWDSRSMSEGGSRWFHVYGPDGITPDDPLFFTRATQNWNHMCADCHSTHVARDYDVNTDSFDTQWSELSVGCEACHGPGAAHVQSAHADPTHPVRLARTFGPSEPWFPSVTGSPTPRPRNENPVETCAPCHSRRTPLAEGFVADDTLLDHFEPELLWPGRYHADGQVEGEVFEWGSFIQSRMYASGVTCADCHDAHSGKLRASGNDLCGGCHDASKFSTSAHTRHSGINAPLCVDCHMPPATFMQIDERRDHSIRIPRPDHSVKFGTPNACSGCHSDKSPTWARDWTQRWYPGLEQRPHFVEALFKDRSGAPDAAAALRHLAADTTAPTIARATALERLGRYPTPPTLEALRKGVSAADALVVFGAVLGAGQLPPDTRASLLTPLIDNKKLAIRVAAAKALAGTSVAAQPSRATPALDRAFEEVQRSFDVNASRAETHVERAAFEQSRGALGSAATALETALRLEPCLVEAHLNVADLERQRGNEAHAQRAIRSALDCDERHPGAQHSMGLWHVRNGQLEQGVERLRRAVALAPNDSRFSYVLALALKAQGRTRTAIGVLEENVSRHPNDVESLRALVSFLQAEGDSTRAALARAALQKVTAH